MASETITRNDLTAILNSVLPNPADMTPQEVEDFVDNLDVNSGALGIIPDYSNVTEISSLPYTAPSHGIVMYVVGDGSVAGARDLLVNGVQVGVAYNAVGNPYATISTLTALVAKGDIVSSTYALWGHMRFIPYSLGV